VRFFDDMYDYKLKSLKEYVENKERKNKKWPLDQQNNAT
jgi:hypothetical protein